MFHSYIINVLHLAQYRSIQIKKYKVYGDQNKQLHRKIVYFFNYGDLRASFRVLTVAQNMSNYSICTRNSKRPDLWPLAQQFNQIKYIYGTRTCLLSNWKTILRNML